MMRLVLFLLMLIPGLSFADDLANPLNFTPPPSDLSVTFLSSLFGTVDGVLYSSGSQIMGAMFGIFNAAVLSLGGIILLYTMLVSTLNTAHEGELLGRKWSSIWIPLRCTAGLALLLPKSSGYCIMQIFVMWVVLQGVGAADKVWEGALGYLQRGGVIVQTSNSNTTSNANNSIFQGASVILTGTTCMSALQQQLINLRTKYLADAEKKTGPCYSANGTLSATWTALCNNPVPDFLGSVNPGTVLPGSDGNYILLMPNFDKTDPYAGLNGICGTLHWNKLSNPPNTTGMSDADAAAVKDSRNIAVQQMYMDLSGVGQAVVQNDNNLIAPPLQPGTNTGKSPPDFTDWAMYPFGLPATSSGNTVCSSQPVSGSSGSTSWDSTTGATTTDTGSSATNTYVDPNAQAASSSDYSGSCTNWVTVTGTTNPNNNPALLSGKELRGAVDDYNGIMNSTLNLQNNSTQVQQATAFINNAKVFGWILAGSYFFDLAQLNNAYGSRAYNDSDSGLSIAADGSNYLPSTSTVYPGSSFCEKDKSVANGKTYLCSWYLGNGSWSSTSLITQYNTQIVQLINGVGLSGNPTCTTPKNLDPPYTGNSSTSPVTGVFYSGACGATIWGYVNNASNVIIPGQSAGTPQFVMKFEYANSQQVTLLPAANFSGGFLNIPGLVTTMIYNYALRTVFNMLMTIMAPMVQQILFAMCSPLFLLVGVIFATAVQDISDPTRNPILALAQMGNTYINSIITTWLTLTMLTAFAAMTPMTGVAIIVLTIMVIPVLGAWMLILFGVGILTAYYVPLLPYMLFTFGGFGWLIAVIEAMVAAPIVALGVTHPEGHEAFGKGEQAIMLLLNVFLRPSMMIIGFIAGIALSYVGVWLMNQGFQHAMNGMMGNTYTSMYDASTNTSSTANTVSTAQQATQAIAMGPMGFLATSPTSTSGNTQWTALFAYFFLIFIYTGMYIAIVEKAFELIHILPDKVLRWLSGGVSEQFGSEASGMARGIKEETKGAGQATGKGLSSMKAEAPGSKPPEGDQASGEATGGDEGGATVQPEATPGDGSGA